jgi:hypothetical protein
VTDPAAVAPLSIGALRRNLAAHAARNGAILAGGTKAEMSERLERVLTLRRQDLVVRAMMWDDAREESRELANENGGE